MLDDLILSQDFSDKDKWQQLLSPSANEILAVVQGSEIRAKDDAAQDLDLSITATNRQAIRAFVLAGSVAASGGGVGASLSGAGASATNRINSDTQAVLRDTTGRAVWVDGDVTLLADNQAEVRTQVMAVSVAAAFGALAGSVAVGVSTALNEIAGSTKAYVDNAVLGADGDIRISALDRPSIQGSSTAVAGSWALRRSRSRTMPRAARLMRIPTATWVRM